jgi:hypothetical protein
MTRGDSGGEKGGIRAKAVREGAMVEGAGGRAKHFFAKRGAETPRILGLPKKSSSSRHFPLAATRPHP